MANSLGGLVVSLGLNSAEYTAGLTKAELQARKFADNVSTAILQVGKVLAGLELGKQFLDATKEIISSASALSSLSGTTGSSVEALSKLQNQAQIAGTSFETMQSALAKLASGMGGAGKGAKETQRALQTLGITATDPAQALQDVAVALDKYKDGTGKAAIATALLGEQGRAFLPTLKAMAELQEVQATTTTKQAEEAEKLEMMWRRLSVESTTFKNIILNDLVPALLVMLEDFRVGIQLAGGFWESLRLFGTLNPFDTPREGINKMQEKLVDLNKLLSETDPGVIRYRGLKMEIADVNKQLDFLRTKERQAGNLLINPANNDQRDRMVQNKPELNFKPPDTGRGPNLAKKNLTQDLKELEEFVASERETLQEREKFLSLYYQDDLIGVRQFFEGRRNALAEATEKQVAALQKEEAILQEFASHAKPGDRIDAETKLAEVIAKRSKLQQESSAKAIELYLGEQRALQQLKDSVEQASIALANMRGDTVTAAAAGFDFASRKIKAQLEQLQQSANPADQSLAAIGLRDIEATRALTIQRAALTKATEEYQLTLEELGIAQQGIQNAEDVGAISATQAFEKRQALSAAYVEKLKEELAILEAIAAASGKREDQVKAAKARLELETVAVNSLKEAQKAMQDFQNTLSASFADSFEGFIMGTKSASQAFKDFANDVERYLLKIALQKVGDQLFGGTTSSGNDIFSAIFKLFSSSSTGGGFGTGPYSFADAGTSFAYGGRTMVGENGPEVMDMPRGARVWPNGTGPEGQAQAVHVENHFHVTGTVNAATVRQIERGVGDSVARNRIDR